MLKRKAINELIKWKETQPYIPILITGAKGVGKTYLAYDFGKAYFENICYMNFEREPLLKKMFFAKDYNSLKAQILSHMQPIPELNNETAILILDEIIINEEVIYFLDTLKIFELFHHIIMISSYPVSYEQKERFQRLFLYPLDFDESLRATNNEWYIELITNHYNNNKKIPDIVHKELLEIHQLYLKIGGMPGAINEYLNLAMLINIPEQHNFVIGSYQDSILRDYADSEAFKMKQVYSSLVSQLMKDNKKFQYRLIRKGTTHTMYKDAIRRLSDINYVIRCNRISNEQLKEFNYNYKQLERIKDTINFKLYFSDTGLLFTKILEEYGIVHDKTQQKAILENYVAQSLQSNQYPLLFWESESMAKVDFVICKDKRLVPIEIHETKNTRSKSISILKQKANFDYAIKISTKNFDFSNQIKYVPIYAVFCI